MIQRQSATGVDVEQDESWATDRRRAGAESSRKAADELGFSRAEITFEGDAFAADQRSRQLFCNRFGFPDAVGLVRLHRVQSVCSQPAAASGRKTPWSMSTIFEPAATLP